jgi:hypothetical protein
MQEKYLSKDQMQAILDTRPKGVSMDDALNMYVKNGWTIQGVNEQPTVVQQAKDVATGFVKGAGRTLVNTASGIQDIGQGVLGGAEALATGKSLSETKAMQPGVGIEALKGETPQGQAVTQALQSTNEAQKLGGQLETGAELLLGGGAQLLKAGAVKGAELITGSKLIPEVKTLVTSAKTAVTPDSGAIMQRVARIPKGKQIKFQETAGESVGDYLVKRGIYGDEEQIVEQLYKRFNDSKNVADEAIAQLPGTFKPVQVKDALEMLTEKFAKASTGVVRDEAGKVVNITGVKDPNFTRATELLQKVEGEGLTMSEINEAKRLFERNVKLDFARENSADGIRLANNVDEAIRTWQFSQAEKLGLQNLPEINKETRLARQLMDDLGAESAGIAGNNAVSLTDWIVLAEGNPASIAAFLGKKAAASKKLQSAVAKKFAPEASVGEPKAIFKTPTNTTSQPTQKESLESLSKITPKTFEELVGNANRYQPQFKKSVSSIAKNLGFDVKIGNPKLLKTFEDKKLRPGEENFTIKDARDANRATILVSSEKDLSKVEQEIAKQFEVSRVKNKFGNGYAYKSAIFNVKTPAGHEAEIAITTPKMWEAKITEGDALYRVVRAGAKGWEEAEKKMLELYKRAN